MEVTGLAGNLPLGLSVFGAYLRGLDIDQWIHALPRFRTSLNGDIEKVLRFGYDALCDEDQQLFLHIACFFKGECIRELVEYLAESRLNVIHGLEVLVDKSFISIHEDGYLMIHNLLEQLGKEIVRRQSVSKPGKRQFLVDPGEINDVLADNKGTGSILGIDHDLSEIRGELIIDEKAFEKMCSLQFLRFKGLYNNFKLILPQGLKFRASKLRFLQWDQYPLTSFPPEFHPQFLVKLEMQDSRLEMWEGPIPLPCLKRMNLIGSRNLKKIPNLSNATNLEVLRAGFCSSLVELPSSIGMVTSLQELHLNFCRNLMAIPSSIGNATNIKALNHLHCQSLVELPSSIGNLKRLNYLSVVGCSKLDYRGLRLKSFPDISKITGSLILSNTTLQEVPSSINSWSRLRTLRMCCCEGLKVFPNVPVRIEVLDLSLTGIEEVPPSIQNLSRLRKLSMWGCKKLKVLPTNINLESLSSLDLSYCTGLKMFPEISTSIEYLELRDTAIEEVPSSIWSWYRLLELNVEDCKSLQLFHIVLDSIGEMDLSNTETKLLGGGLETIPVDIDDWLLPLRINLKGCKNLVSLPHLSDFLSFLDAAGCESIERIEGYFPPKVTLNFANCFKLSQEARELIQTSNFKFAFLPGVELPAYFDHRARGNSVTVNLDQRPLPKLLRFKACLLLHHGTYYHYHGDGEVDRSTDAKMLSCRIWCIQNDFVTGYGSCKYHLPALLGFTEHLYFFESSISLNFPETDVDFNELDFEFKINGEYWKVKGCGVVLLEDPDDVHDDHDESADIKIGENLHGGRTRTDNNLRLEYYYAYDVYRNRTREWGACVLVALLCIGILGFNRLEKFLILLLSLLIYGISMCQ